MALEMNCVLGVAAALTLIAEVRNGKISGYEVEANRDMFLEDDKKQGS